MTRQSTSSPPPRAIFGGTTTLGHGEEEMVTIVPYGGAVMFGYHERVGRAKGRMDRNLEAWDDDNAVGTEVDVGDGEFGGMQLRPVESVGGTVMESVGVGSVGEESASVPGTEVSDDSDGVMTLGEEKEDPTDPAIPSQLRIEEWRKTVPAVPPKPNFPTSTSAPAPAPAKCGLLQLDTMIQRIREVHDEILALRALAEGAATTLDREDIAASTAAILSDSGSETDMATDSSLSGLSTRPYGLGSTEPNEATITDLDQSQQQIGYSSSGEAGAPGDIGMEAQEDNEQVGEEEEWDGEEEEEGWGEVVKAEYEGEDVIEKWLEEEEEKWCKQGVEEWGEEEMRRWGSVGLDWGEDVEKWLEEEEEEKWWEEEEEEKWWEEEEGEGEGEGWDESPGSECEIEWAAGSEEMEELSEDADLETPNTEATQPIASAAASVCCEEGELHPDKLLHVGNCQYTTHRNLDTMLREVRELKGRVDGLAARQKWAEGELRVANPGIGRVLVLTLVVFAGPFGVYLLCELLLSC